MAHEVPFHVIGTLQATADLSALQYTFVTVTTLGGVTGTTINTQRPIGVLQNTPTSNQRCEIMVSGISKLVAGTSALVAGDLIGSTNGGKAVTITTGSSNWYAGQVLEGTLSTTFNGLITALVFPAQRSL
jgi:hypothetical protein